MTKRFICLIVAVIGMIGTITAQSNNKVKKYGFSIGGHNQDAEYGSLIDIKDGKVYKIADVVNNQGDIDLLYAYGVTTKANFLTPNSTAVKQFGNNYKTKIDEAWELKNRGLMVVLKGAKENRKIFKKLKQNQDIENLYTKSAKSVRNLEDYNQTKYGPSRRIIDLEEGDLILFRSQSRKFYAAGLIVGLKTGTKGVIDVDFKITQ